MDMNPEDRSEGLPLEVVEDVAAVIGEDVAVLGRLPGGVNSGGVRIRLGGHRTAVVKTDVLTHAGLLEEVLRAQRIVGHMRGCGYPTPAWLGAGATSTHVWQVCDFVDAAPVSELTPSVVDQLMEIIEVQAGQASEPYDHWTYAWRVATGREPVGAKISRHSVEVAALVERVRLVCGDAPPPVGMPDMVHADLNPSNVLVRDGVVVALVDIGNAGSGTRATDLITVLWHTFEPALEGARQRLWTRILALVGWRQAAVLAATQILLQVQVPIRRGHHELVPAVVERGHRAMDELNGLR